MKNIILGLMCLIAIVSSRAAHADLKIPVGSTFIQKKGFALHRNNSYTIEFKEVQGAGGCLLYLNARSTDVTEDVYLFNPPETLGRDGMMITEPDSISIPLRYGRFHLTLLCGTLSTNTLTMDRFQKAISEYFTLMIPAPAPTSVDAILY